MPSPSLKRFATPKAPAESTASLPVESLATRKPTSQGTASSSIDYPPPLSESGQSNKQPCFPPRNPTPVRTSDSGNRPNGSDSRPPRRVIRPDDWWQNRESQAVVATEADTPPPIPERSPLRLLPPPIPERSPLRLLRRPSQPLALRIAKAPVVNPERVEPYLESHEDRALYEELSPPPLVLRKLRNPATAPGAVTPARPPRQIAPAEPTATLQPLKTTPSHLNIDRANTRIRSKEALTYADKSPSAARGQEQLTPRVIAHRQEALEILCSPPPLGEKDSLA